MSSSEVSRTTKGLCEILRQQDARSGDGGVEQPCSEQEQSSSKEKSWKKFEERVERVYDTLLNVEGEKVSVSQDVKLKGRDGLVHQFDVYYEFSRAGVAHRVAIECRDKGRPIEKDAVMAFRSKVFDVPGLQGVMVSAKGYQSGARKYAEDNGVLAINMDELPGVGGLIATRLENIMLPDEDGIGEPFWGIYELEDGRVNGNIYAQTIGGWYGALLFFSKRICEEVLRSENAVNGSRYTVRGLRQRHLRGFIMTADAFRANYWLVLDVKPNGHVGLVQIDREDLIKDYVVGNHSLPKEPMVMPRYKK